MAPGSGGEDIDKGWAWVVMAATYLGLVMFSTSFFTIGVIYVALLEHYHDDKVKTSLVGTLNTAIYCLMAPFANAFASRFTCRISIVIGGLLMASSGVLSSFASSVDMLILTHGIIGGIGNTLVGIPLGIILSYYFEKRRHFVISISAAVFGIGMFLATPMALRIFKEYGIQGGFMILSGFNLHMCVIGMLCKPSSMELKIQRHKVADKTFTARTSSGTITINRVTTCIQDYMVQLNKLFHVEMLTDVKFILFLFSTFTWNFALAICQMHLPNYMLLQGSGSSEITIIMTLFGACNTIGRFFGAFSVNCSQVNTLVVHVILLAISGILVLTFPIYGHLTGANYCFASSIGLLTGGPNGFMASIALSILGLRKLAAAHGLEYFFCGLAVGSGPPIASALYSQSGSYTSSFIFAGITVIVGSILGLLAHIRSRSENMPGESVTVLRKDVMQPKHCDSEIVDSLLLTNDTKNGTCVKRKGLHPDILTLAGSTHSLTL